MNYILIPISDLDEPLELDFWTAARVRILELLDYFLDISPSPRRLGQNFYGLNISPQIHQLKLIHQCDIRSGAFTKWLLFGSETKWIDWRETVRSCLDFHCEGARVTILEAENSLFLTPTCWLLHPAISASSKVVSEFLSFRTPSFTNSFVCICWPENNSGCHP